jgi:beta-glucanase (GH16 family)
LYIDKELRNYRLKVEYRFVGQTAPGSPEWGYRDSGIQFHGQAPVTQKLDQAFPMCLEYNFHGGNGTEDRPSGAACGYGIFFEINGDKNSSTCVPATVSKTFHGDQWVTAELDVKDGKITHFANGEEILSYANPTYDPNHEIAKDLITTGNTAVKGGYISFQSNSHPIDFRKIELLEY